MTMAEFVEGDLLVLAVFLVVLIAILLLSEGLHHRWSWRSESSRRLVHSLTGLIVVVSISYFDSPLSLYLFASLFVLLNLFFSKRKIFAGIHDIERSSLGTVTFPLALVLGLFLCWTLSIERKGILQMAFLIMAISDPLASLIGMRFGNEKTKILGQKTWVGMVAFVLSTSSLLFAFDFFLLQHRLSPIEIVVFSSFLGLLELISRNGWDNLFIVLGVICTLTWSIEKSADLSSASDVHVDLFLLILTTAVLTFILVSLKLNYLDRSGAAAAGILGFTLVLIGSWQWVMPALVFFGTSSWLSKLRPIREEGEEHILDKGSTRDDGQVWANGGVAILIAVLSLFFPSSIWFVCLAASFAAAAADTWATEIGMRWGKSPRSLLTFKRVERGVSGGVSFFGSLGAIFGALAIAVTYYFLANDPFWWEYFFLILLSGFLASIIDSLLGATLQAKYEDASGRLTEKRGSTSGGHKLVHGFEFVDNDAVNLFSIASASILVLIVHQIF